MTKDIEKLIRRFELTVGEVEELHAVTGLSLQELAEEVDKTFVVSRLDSMVLEAMFYSHDKGRGELQDIIQELLYEWDTSLGFNTLADIIVTLHQDIKIITIDEDNPLYVGLNLHQQGGN